ncbi:hypothetical protein [Duganella sp. FT27W]|uniref:hypothetical protein n=1 Tax=Duganella sp. FT27W TaxID=2654636 RepID=UPI00128D1678|nr:hypothetical protein [Duganella sp. FT27W]MPQ56319.1 hypothetical protein [Duganella sp. FT27W]
MKTPPLKRPYLLLIEAILALFLMLGLFGCSTQRAPAVSWSIPAETLRKSDPLPEIALDPKAADDDATNIDLPAMVQIDLALTKTCRAVIARHNLLVDEVMAYLRKQADAGQ